jgi:hypothetical protein
MGNEYSVSSVGGNWDYGSTAGGFYRSVTYAPSDRNRNRGRHVLFMQRINEKIL